MKLTPERIDQALSQFTAQPVPDNHPVVAQFNELFGDHTFFLDVNGLNIIEPTTPGIAPVEAKVGMGQVVKLASWIDESRSGLAPHEREYTPVVVVLDRAA